LITASRFTAARRAKDAGVSGKVFRPGCGALLPRWRSSSGPNASSGHRSSNEPHAQKFGLLARAHRSFPLVVSRRIAARYRRIRFLWRDIAQPARIIAISHLSKKSCSASGLAEDYVEVIYDGVTIQRGFFASGL